MYALIIIILDYDDKKEVLEPIDNDTNKSSSCTDELISFADYTRLFMTFPNTLITLAMSMKTNLTFLRIQMF